MDLDSEIRQRLRYIPETGKLYWNKIPENNKWDKMFNTRYSDEEAGCIQGKGYIGIWFQGERFLAHRLAWFLYYGFWPKNEIDHINQIKSNNRIDNLREVDRTTNSRNTCKYKTNTSGFTGVYYCKIRSKWTAQIVSKGKKRNLGRFDTIEEALEARTKAEKDLGFHNNHGKRSNQNVKAN